MRSLCVIPCLALAGLLSPLVATANAAANIHGYESATRVVNFSDLDINTPRGASTLYSRIMSAAKDVCAPADFRFVDSVMRQRHCEEKAIGQAVADVKSSQLLTLHMAATNQTNVAVNR
jgi:UrcA family protein